MAGKPADKNRLPTLLTQNPSMVAGVGQEYQHKKRAQVDSIMAVFMQTLPSNYVSQVQGPFYTIQFQAAAEALAEFQLTAQEAFADSDYDFTRGEFLFQLLGSLVFPDAVTNGYPTLRGDLTYRDFLKRMVTLLLQGATLESVGGGLSLLSDAVFTVIEKSLESNRTKKRVWNSSIGRWEVVSGSAWGFNDQFEFEINVEQPENQFPGDPTELAENVRIVMRALKPAHTIYEYRHLFRETFGNMFSASSSWEMSEYFYCDFRKFYGGARVVTGTGGVTWADRTLFGDPSRDFSHIQVGAELTILSGPNSIHVGGQEGTVDSSDRREVGRFKVIDVMYFPVGSDPLPREYTTSPSGFEGYAVITSRDVEDYGVLGLFGDVGLKVLATSSVRFLAGAFFIRIAGELFVPVGVTEFSADPDGIEYLTAVSGSNPIGALKFGSHLLSDPTYEDANVVYVGDWASSTEGETLTFLEGPNAGTYRLRDLLGNDGGPAGFAVGPVTRVRVAPSILRVDRRMRTAVAGQQYTVSVDRLGVQEPNQVVGEDASILFVC